MLIQMWNSDSKPENESKKENENENEERTRKITSRIHIHGKEGGERRDVKKVEEDEDDEEDRERGGRRLRRRRSRTSLAHWLSFFWLLSSICLSCGNSLQIQTQSPPVAAFTTENIISLSLETETENQNLESSLSSLSPQTFTGESQSESQNYNSATHLHTVLKLPGESLTDHNDQLPENNRIQESGSESDEHLYHSSSVPSDVNPTKFSTHATTLTTIKESLKSATTTIVTSTTTTTTKFPENSKTSLSPQHHPFSPVKAPSIKLDKTEGENEKIINTLSNNDKEETFPLAEKLPLPHVKKQAPSNMGMLRNMWSSTRTGKLNMNLTQEHESILRIETQKERDKNKNKNNPVELLSPATTTGHAPQIQGISLSHSQNEIGEIPELKTKTTFLSTNDHFHDREEGKLIQTEEKLKYKSAILYPEWLSSSGGVYPDDNNNFTGDYYTDQAAYEHERDHDASQGQEKAPGVSEQKSKPDREEMARERDISSPRKNLRKRINDEILARIINKTTPAVSVGVDAGSGSSSHVMIGSSSSSLDSPGLSILKSSHSHQSSRAGLVNLKISPGNSDSRGESRGGESQSESQNSNSQIQSVESNTANNLKLLQELQENGAGSFESSASNGLVTSMGSSSSSSSSSNAVQPGLADVISRGRIDSVMYVYFGDKYNDYHKEEVAGRIIQAVGGVVAAIAQVLTVLGAAKCVRRVTHSQSLPVHLHIGFALLLSNLLLLLAVHATEPLDVCASVALILHYLHLVIGCWLFAHTLQTYRALCRHVSAPTLLSPDQDPSDSSHIQSFRMIKPSTIRYSIAAWTAPVPFLIMSYILNPNGYETHRYCWMSIEKGMVISFIVPIFFLIGLNTFLVVLSLRHLLALRKLWEDGSVVGEVDEDTLDGKIISSGIRASAMLLPLLAIMWFLGVVALENSTSIFFQLAATLANIALSWLVLYFLGEDVWPESWCHLAKLDRVRRDSSLYEDALNSSVQPSSAQLSFDNEPLLTAAAPVPSTSSQLLSSSSSAAVAAALAATCHPRHGTSSSSSSSSSGIINGYASASHKIATPSTLLPGQGLVHVSLNGGGVGVGVSGGINNNSGSATSTITAGMSGAGTGGGVGGGGGGKHHPNPAALSHPHPSTSSSSTSATSSRWPKNNNRPNWSRPGGNEIYELRHDAISTIYK